MPFRAPRRIHLATPFVLLACIALSTSPASAASLFWGDVQDDGSQSTSTGLQQLSPHNILLGDSYASINGGVGGAVSAEARSNGVGMNAFGASRLDLEFRITGTSGVSTVDVTATGLQFLTLNGISGGRVTGGITTGGPFPLYEIVFPQLIWNCYAEDCDYHQSGVYVETGEMPVSTTLTLFLYVDVDARSGGWARAFHDPILTFSDPAATLDKLGGWPTNPDFIMPPIPEPSTALLLGMGLVAMSASRRRLRARA
jgi:hypothetical protein